MKNIELKEGFTGQKMFSIPKWMKNNAQNNNITKKFYITDIGYYPNAIHHYRFRNKGAKEYIFIYCTKGKGEIILDKVKTVLYSNQFFIIPKNLRHEYKSNQTDPWSIYWFHFDGEMALNLYNRFTDKNNEAIFKSENIKLFNQIFYLFDNNYTESKIEYASILALNFISYFIYSDYESYGKKAIKDHSSINLIKKYLLNNLDEKITIDEISAKFNYSKSSLQSNFKRNTGYSIINFFIFKKTQRACEYLINTDLTVKEISFKLGFDDPLYFSRVFKKNMGESPRAYKIRHTK